MTIRKPAAGTHATDSTEEIRAEIAETRAQLGDTVEALAAKTDVKARAKEAAEGAKARLGGTVSTGARVVHARAHQLAEKANSPQVRRAVERVRVQVRRRPVPFAVGAGALVLALLAMRRRRNR